RGLAAARGPEQRQLLARHDGKADRANGPDASIADLEILDFDLGAGLQVLHGYAPPSWDARRVSAMKIAIAMPTTNVWINAIAAVSSELVANQASTIAGVSTLEFGPINRMDAPSSRTLAMKRSSHAAMRPGRNSGMVIRRMR